METNTSVKHTPPNSTVTAVISEDVYYYVISTGTLIIFCISIFGFFANVFNMSVFVKMGFQDSINVSLFGISLSDFFNNITSLGYAVFYNPWVIDWCGIPESLIRASMPIIVYPHLFFVKTSVMITTFVALERCLCVAMPIKVKLLFTPTRAKQVLTFAFIFNPVMTALLLLGYRFGWKFDPAVNESIFTITSIKSRAGLFSDLLTFQIFFNFVGPYIFVSICTIILITNLITKSNWRKDVSSKTTTTTTSSGSNKDMKAAKMVVSVLILFIICTLPGMLLKFILVYVGEDLRATGPLYRTSFVIHTVVYIFNGINATCNIFIYYNSSSKYKETFKTMYLSTAQ